MQPVHTRPYYEIRDAAKARWTDAAHACNRHAIDTLMRERATRELERDRG